MPAKHTLRAKRPSLPPILEIDEDGLPIAEMSIMEGRRWSEGLHQAIEAKEGVKIQEENVTLATITLQNYFRLYEKLAGMTGTAKTEEKEFVEIYNLHVVEIPTNVQVARLDENDYIFKTATAKFDAVVPYTWLSGTADYRGDTVSRNVNGFANSAFRFSINLYGAPALTMKEFAAWEQDLIVGASFRVIAPWGQYDDTKIVNIGTNRWSFKPEIGISKALGPWTLEAKAAATFFTANDDFFGGKSLRQDPLYSAQANAIYSFRSGVWGSLDATYYTGGRTTLEGVRNSDLQQNWRLGATLAIPVDRRNSIKLHASSGVSSRTGNDYDLIGAAWQYRWGGGI